METPKMSETETTGPSKPRRESRARRTVEENAEAVAGDEVAAASFVDSDQKAYLSGLKEERVGYAIRIRGAELAGTPTDVLEDRIAQVEVEIKRVKNALAGVEKRDD